MKKIILSLILFVIIGLSVSSCKNDRQDETSPSSVLTNKELLTKVVDANTEIIGMFYENHSKNEVKNFIKNFNSADTDYKKETILKSYFGNSFSTFAKKAEELKNADFELQARKISKEEKLAFVNSYDFSSLNSKMHPNNSLVARNEGAYKRCCTAVIAQAAIMGLGCSALSGGLATLICIGAAATYQMAAIDNCGDTWL